MNKAYISLGSNLGRRGDNLDSAIAKLNAHEKIKVDKVSRQYETYPEGKLDQPMFLNSVAKLSTELMPQELLKALHDIENELGRLRIEKWGPRTIDLDILSFNDMTVNEVDLKIPHPLMAERSFVLEPMSEIAPDFVIPGYKLTVKELFDNITGVVK